MGFQNIVRKGKPTLVHSSSDKPKALIRNIASQPFVLFHRARGYKNVTQKNKKVDVMAARPSKFHLHPVCSLYERQYGTVHGQCGTVHEFQERQYRLLVFQNARKGSPLNCQPIGTIHRKFQARTSVRMHLVKPYMTPHHTVNLRNY